MQCPSCGADNPEGASYCSLCHCQFPGGGALLPSASEWSHVPASDRFAAKPARRGFHPVLVWAAALLVLAGLAAGGYLLYARVLHGQKKYVSTSSSLTFAYPRDWKKLDLSAIPKLPGFPELNTEVINEAALADSIIKPRFVMTSGSLPGFSPEQWPELKKQIEINQSSVLAAMMPEGAVISDLMFEDLRVEGSEALQVDARITWMGTSVEVIGLTTCQAGYLYHIAFGYQPGDDGERVFKTLLESVRFSR